MKIHILFILLVTLLNPYQPDESYYDYEYQASREEQERQIQYTLQEQQNQDIYYAPAFGTEEETLYWTCPYCFKQIPYIVTTFYIFYIPISQTYSYNTVDYNSETACINAIKSSHTCQSVSIDANVWELVLFITLILLAPLLKTYYKKSNTHIEEK